MTAIPVGFAGAALRLTVADIDSTAAALGLNPREVWAVATVESLGHGFLHDGRPELLFEAHQFHQLTRGTWDNTHPHISSPTWDASLYGAPGAHQYDRMAEAMALDRAAALQAATWGMFQILGRNYAMVGFASVDDFVAAMCGSEGAHLAAFAAYCIAANLVRFLAAHDWPRFKVGYNGPGADDYAAKLASAYANVVYPPTGMPSGTTPLPPTPTPGPPPMPPTPAPAPSPDPVPAASATLEAELERLVANVGLAVARIVAPTPDPETIAAQFADVTARLGSLSDSIEQALAQGASPSFRP